MLLANCQSNMSKMLCDGPHCSTAMVSLYATEIVKVHFQITVPSV